MSFPTVIASVLSILATFIQTEFQSKSSSLFETHGWIMHTFYVVLFMYVVAGAKLSVQIQAQNAENDNRHEILTKIALLSGALALTMLLLIIRPILGWVALVFWTLYFLKTAYELVHVNALCQLLQTLKIAFVQTFQKIKNAFANVKNAVCGQTKDLTLPVSVSV